MTTVGAIPDDVAGFEITDPAGRTTKYVESGSQVVEIVDFASRETDLSYDTSGAYPQLTTVTLADPNNDYVSGETQPVFSFGYDPTTGLMTSYIDANGNQTLYAYRADGTLQTEIFADGSTAGYQSALYPTLLPGGDGGEGAVGSSSNPAALVLTAQAVGVQTDQSGNPTVYTFDQFGNPTSVENALGDTTAYSYWTTADSVPTSLVQEIDQPNATQDSGYEGQTFSGDSAVGPVTQYSYNSYGMETGETDLANGELQDWVYEILTTSGGTYEVPTQTGEGFGTQQGTVPPVDQIESFSWSASETGTAETYTYDVDLSNNSDNQAYYTHDAGISSDYFVGIVSSDGTVTWTYDGTSESTGTCDAPAGSASITVAHDFVQYSYDTSTGDLLSVTGQDGPSSSETQYTYTTATSPGGSCPAGLVASETDANGNTTTYDYYTSGNQAGLLETIDKPDNTSSVPANLSLYVALDTLDVASASVSYAYNSADDLTSYTDENGDTTTYSYDNLDRVVNETDPAPTSGTQARRRIGHTTPWAT